MSQRDEQFMGFARAVVEEITGRDEYDECDMEEVIAQRAYDLVRHILESPALNGKVVPGYGLLLDIATAPDLPVLPEEDEK